MVVVYGGDDGVNRSGSMIMEEVVVMATMVLVLVVVERVLGEVVVDDRVGGVGADM